jgi:hypothetical protein
MSFRAVLLSSVIAIIFISPISASAFSPPDKTISNINYYFKNIQLTCDSFGNCCDIFGNCAHYPPTLHQYYQSPAPAAEGYASPTPQGYAPPAPQGYPSTQYAPSPQYPGSRRYPEYPIPSQYPQSLVGPQDPAPNDYHPLHGKNPILDTGYAVLPEIGKEDDGFGLYSYAVLVSKSSRSTQFLTEIFKSNPAVDKIEADPTKLNVLYIPIDNGKRSEAAAVLQKWHGKPQKMGEEFGNVLYDFKTARAILVHLCDSPPDSMKVLCSGDLAGGPYIFTYAVPASKLNMIPPPYLFVDLSTVNPRAFGELISAFREQVKREDVSDKARIDTLRLRILQIPLNAADLVVPIEGAVHAAISQIVHSATAATNEKKNEHQE